MDFHKLISERYSVRDYSPKPVEKEKLSLILETGRLAPTAANLQPVKVIAVQTAEGLAKIGKAANLYNAPLALIVLADRSTAWTRSFDGMKTTDIDASIVTDHMMLQASSLGLGSVWICWFKPDVIREEFNLPENLVPVNILALGYKKDEAPTPSKKRIPMQEFVSYETL